MKFDELVKLREEDGQRFTKYILNDNGKEFLADYNRFIKDSLSQWINQDKLMALISRLDTDNIGNENYKLAKRLSTIPKQKDELGQESINPQEISFSENDPIMNYLKKV
jgi:hypothetical protein